MKRKIPSPSINDYSLALLVDDKLRLSPSTKPISDLTRTKVDITKGGGKSVSAEDPLSARCPKCSK